MNTLSRSQLYFLFFGQAIALLPVFFALPKWLILYWLFACCWRIQILQKSWRFPNIFFKLIALVVGLVLLKFSFKNLFSVELFVSFFIINFSLKAIELHRRVDAQLLISLNFICIAIGFLFYQNMMVSLYAVFSLIICIQTWIGLYRHRPVSIGTQFFYASGIVFKALPIMLVLFLTMPRMGQLWQMPSQSQTGQTGISDSMSPGQFNKLIQSNDVAFRVSFPEGVKVPSADQRYWRAMVFELFDGKRWGRAETWRVYNSKQYSSLGRPHSEWGMTYDAASTVSYSVLLEPHQRKWLFSLKPPVQAQSEGLNIRFTHDGTLESRFNVAARASYSVISATQFEYKDTALPSHLRSRNLRLPSGGGTRAQQFAKTLREKFGNGHQADEKIIEEILEFYRASFFYTLQPPSISENFIDAFLFDTQRGFCEHFASTFTYLMRAADIPSRVVVGYQGGEKSPLENYLVVRQRDAHAWSEVWLAGRGWLRIDPTAAVAPSRIEQGLAAAVGSDDRALVGSGFSGIGTLAWLQLRMDLLSFNWHKWVLSYDDRSQSHFFKKMLGGADAWRVALFFILSCGGLFALYFILTMLPSRPARFYTESRPYALHLARLAQKGHHKRPNESPMQFALRVSSKHPAWKTDLIAIADAYDGLAYSDSPKVSQKQFVQMCRNWRA